eukprot:PhF_6_TR19283/c0_g1_i1/m.28348
MKPQQHHVFPIDAATPDHIMQHHGDHFYKENLKRIDWYLTTKYKETSTAEMEPFVIPAPPPISLKDYLSRVMKKSSTSIGACISALIYIERLHEMGHCITTQNVHKLVAVAARVSAKVWDDTVLHPADYALLSGLQHTTLTEMESYFGSLLGFKLSVTVEEYKRIVFVIGLKLPEGFPEPIE